MARYEGEFVDGRAEGKATVAFADGRVYEEGAWKGGRANNGNGKMKYANGDECEGEWRDGNMNGQGKMTWPDGTVYECGWENGKLNGQCLMVVDTWCRLASWRHLCLRTIELQLVELTVLLCGEIFVYCIRWRQSV